MIGSRARLGLLLSLVGASLFLGGCAGKVPKPPAGAPAAAGSSPAPSPVPSPALATDPDPRADPCTGYGLDGIAVGMVRSEVERTVSLIPVHAPGHDPGVAASQFSFLAIRLGRKDDVQLTFEPQGKDPRVRIMYARIFVSPTDGWPASLFALLGSPKRARVDEWVWWDARCGLTLRLTKVDRLGGGEAQPYVLEVERIKPS